MRKEKQISKDQKLYKALCVCLYSTHLSSLLFRYNGDNDKQLLFFSKPAQNQH
jgi:hypothetical protein